MCNVFIGEMLQTLKYRLDSPHVVVDMTATYSFLLWVISAINSLLNRWFSSGTRIFLVFIPTVKIS